MKNLLMLYVVFMTCINSTHAQYNANSAIKKGEEVPDFQFAIRQKENLRSVKLSHFKGKLLLIDFWGVYCTNCINSFPHLEDLQLRFKDQIQILLVTSDSRQQIEKLKSKLEKSPTFHDNLNALNALTIVESDSVFHQLFPHDGQPTHVWIDEQQRFLKMTNGQSTTTAAIQEYLKGENNVFPDEQSLIGIDLSKPLSWIGTVKETKSSVEFYSFIVKGVVGRVPTGIPRDFTPTSVSIERDSLSNSVIGLSCINNPIISLYKIAYQREMPQLSFIPLNRIIIETQNQSNFYFRNDGSFAKWMATNIYSYAVRAPADHAVDLYKIMQADLNRYFKLESRVEKRKIKCLVLTKANAGFSAVMKDQYMITNASSLSGIHLQFRNVLIKELINYIQDNLLPGDRDMPFFNETGYTGKINLLFEVSKSRSNNAIVYLQQELEKYGLCLNYEYRELEILLIKDKR